VLGANVLGIGQTVYASRIAAACLAVQGVAAIHDLSFATDDPHFGIIVRHFTGNRLPRLGLANVGSSACDGYAYLPGAGRYFSVPNDGQHLQLKPAATS
jgi:hypothetical protein